MKIYENMNGYCWIYMYEDLHVPTFVARCVLYDFVVYYIV